MCAWQGVDGNDDGAYVCNGESRKIKDEIWFCQMVHSSESWGLTPCKQNFGNALRES